MCSGGGGSSPKPAPRMEPAKSVSEVNKVARENVRRRNAMLAAMQENNPTGPLGVLGQANTQRTLLGGG